MNYFILTFCNFVLKRRHNCYHKILHRLLFIFQLKNLNKILVGHFSSHQKRLNLSPISRASCGSKHLPLIPLFAFYFQDIAIVACLHLYSILFANNSVYSRSFQELRPIFYRIATGS